MATMVDPGDHAREVAALFARMATSIDDYRTEHFEELSEEQRNLLREEEERLDDLHDRLIELAIQGTLDSLGSDLARIEAVTRKAKQSIAHLKTYEEVVRIASAAVEVGAAALTGDAGMIASSIEDLAKLLPKQT